MVPPMTRLAPHDFSFARMCLCFVFALVPFVFLFFRTRRTARTGLPSCRSVSYSTASPAVPRCVGTRVIDKHHKQFVVSAVPRVRVGREGRYTLSVLFERLYLAATQLVLLLSWCVAVFLVPTAAPTYVLRVCRNRLETNLSRKHVMCRCMVCVLCVEFS